MGRRTSGYTAGFIAYALWGVLPLYFPLLRPAGPLEIIGHRIVWSLVFCVVLLAALRRLRSFTALLARPRMMLALTGAALLLGANWSIYVYATLNDHVVDASLGYFINPLVTVALAVGVLGERLRPAQWVAIGLGTVAVGVIWAGYGRLPWIGLSLAVTFAGYSLVKKKVAATVDALPGLAAETLALAPLALLYLGWLQVDGTSSMIGHGWRHVVMLTTAGAVTAVPLLLFNAATRTVPLSVLGLFQYVTPVLQFVIGVLVVHESMSPARWWGFGIVWVGLVVMSVDAVRSARSRRGVRAA